MYRSLIFTLISVALTTWRLYWDNDYLAFAAVFSVMAAFWFALSELNECLLQETGRKYFRFVPVVCAGIAGYELFILYRAEKEGGI